MTFKPTLIALAVALALPGLSPAATSSPVAAPAWGFELSKRAPDPHVRFGRLPNGMRYAIEHNETPKDGVAMRMRIGAGSMAERDEEQGLAHFLEHMAFRGSKRVPDGEVVRMLERQGLSFGPDTNAFTAPEQTVYMFNFPKADPSALDTGFTLFREIGEHLTLDAALLEKEKGVVLSEERARDVPGMRAYLAEVKNELAGSRFAERMPIGQVATIQAATSARLQRYYKANYRPDNATIIVVGNIDVDAVERQIRARFSDWKSTAKPEVLKLGKAKPAQPAVEMVAQGLGDSLTLAWVLPPDTRVGTLAVEREKMIEQVAVAMLNLHLTDRTLLPGSPILGAGGSMFPPAYGVEWLAKLQVTAAPDRWQAALDGAVEELRRLLKDGVTAADLQRFMPRMRSYMEASVAQASTRQNGAIADALLMSVNGGGTYTSAAQSWADAEPMLASITPDEVTAMLRRLYTGQPVLFRSASAGAVGVSALSAQLNQALSRPLEARAAQTLADWPYTDFGAPSAVLDRSTDAELGSTTVRFANGTRLVVKSTAQDKDKIGVQVLLGQGRSGIAKERAHALWALNSMPMGGTGKRSLAEFLQWQQGSGKLLGVQLRAEPYSFVLSGDTRPADLRAQLQVLAAYARDPGFRPELNEKLAASGPMIVNQLDGIPAIVHMREMLNVMTGGDARMLGLANAADVAATRAEDLPAILREALAGAADVVIVGDVSVDEAIAATQATFGAGPARPRASRLPLALTAPADGGAPHLVLHTGRADQGVLAEYWAMPDQWSDPALSYTGRVAAEVMQARLIETVREKLGITYSPGASGGGSIDLPGRGDFTVRLETPPEKFDTFRTLLKAQLRELADKPVSADELQRAKQPMIERSLKAPQNNGHWAYWLPRMFDDTRMKGAMLGETAGLQAVSAAQVQSFFRDHIVERTPVEVVAKAR